MDFCNAKRKKQQLIGHLPEGAPPHSLEAERGVLGCISLCPIECIDLCQERFKGEHNQIFYDLRHGAIYSAMLEIWNKSRVLDSVALLDYLRRTNQLEAVGGVVYLFSLADDVPSAANLLYYLDIVLECYGLRRMVALCTEYIGRAYEFVPDIERFIDEFERDALMLSMFRQNAAGEGKLTQFLIEHQNRLEEGWKQGGRGLGLSTGFPELDEQMGGMSPGNLIILAGGPSDGKTALAGNIVAYNARQKIGSSFFSMEMTGEEMAARFASEQSGVPLKRATRGMDAEDQDRYATAMKAVNAWPTWIVQEPGITMGQIRSRARRHRNEHKIELVVLDFIQLIEAGIRTDSRNHAVGHIAKESKAMAKELGVPVLALSQLSRDHKKQNRRPGLHDLRESGDVEAAADKVLFLYRPKAESNIVEVIVGKNRNEAKGRIELQFNAPIFRFEPLSEEPGI